MNTQTIASPSPLPNRLLRLPECLHKTGLSKSAFQKKISEGEIPRPVSLGARSVAWPESEIDAWIAEKLAQPREPNRGADVARAVRYARQAIRRKKEAATSKTSEG